MKDQEERTPPPPAPPPPVANKMEVDLSPSPSSSLRQYEMEMDLTPTTTAVSLSTSVSFSSSPSSFSASSSSSSPSTAMVVREQPSLPPGPIEKTMQAASVVANLIAFDKSNPDENARLAKTDELKEYLGGGAAGGITASALSRYLPMLIETSRADSAAVRSSNEGQYIRDVQDKIDNGNPNYKIHKVLFSQVGVVDKSKFKRVPKDQYHPYMLKTLALYKAQCGAEGKPFDPLKIPTCASLDGGKTTKALYHYVNKVRRGYYDDVPEYEAIVPQLEKDLGSVSKAIPFEELCTVIDSLYDALECKDLATYLVKVPDIHKRGYGTSILSTDPDALALMDPTDSVKINARVNGAFGLLSRIPRGPLTEADRELLRSIITILCYELCKAQKAGTIRLLETELQQLIEATKQRLSQFLTRYDYIKHKNRYARFDCGTNGERHHPVQITAVDTDSLSHRDFLVFLGFSRKVAHAMAKLKKETFEGRAMLGIRTYFNKKEWNIEGNYCVSMTQGEANWMREGRRTSDGSKEVEIPLDTIVKTNHRGDLNRLEEAMQRHLKGLGGFFDETKCPPPFSSEEKRPDHLLAPKKTSKKIKDVSINSDGSISLKDIDGAVAEVQESSDISDAAKNVLAKASTLLAAVPALSHPSAAREATASPTDLAALVAAADVASTTDANIGKTPPLSEAPPMPKLPSKIIQLDPISQCQVAQLTASAALMASGNQQHSFAFAPAPAPLAATTTTTTSSQGSNEKPATVSASETENAQSLSATSSPRYGDDSDSDDDSDSGEEEVVEEGTYLSSGQYDVQYDVHRHRTDREKLEEEVARHQETSAQLERVKGFLKQERTTSAEMSGQAEQEKTSLITARMRINELTRDKNLAEESLANAESQMAKLEASNATLRAKLAAFELEYHLPPGWVSQVFSVFNIRHVEHFSSI